jgi:hypothetical protein
MLGIKIAQNKIGDQNCELCKIGGDQNCLKQNRGTKITYFVK